MKPKKAKNSQTHVSAQVTVQEAGRHGGRATLEHQGIEFYREIGRKGGKRTAQLYGRLLKEFGRKGGRPTRPSLGDSVGGEDR